MPAPKDPAYEARVRESFARQSHMATLGITIAFIAPGEVHLALPFAARFCQQNGFMHAGAIASVADSASGYAASTLAPPDTDVLAVEFKLNLLAPARGEGFIACARVLRAGRTLTVCQADVFSTGAGERTLIATMLSTVIVRPVESRQSDPTYVQMLAKGGESMVKLIDQDSTERVIEP